MKFESRIIAYTEDGRSNVEMLRISQDFGGDLAFIDWEPAGELYYIKVPEQHRRKGIATQLWNAANDYAKAENLEPIRHSQYRSKDGDAWARSFGTDLPTRIAI